MLQDVEHVMGPWGCFWNRLESISDNVPQYEKWNIYNIHGMYISIFYTYKLYIHTGPDYMVYMSIPNALLIGYWMERTTNTESCAEARASVQLKIASVNSSSTSFPAAELGQTNPFILLINPIGVLLLGWILVIGYPNNISKYPNKKNCFRSQNQLNFNI